MGIRHGASRGSRLVAVGIVCLLLAVACGDDEGTGATGGNGTTTPRVALTAPTQPWNVWVRWGPTEYGSEFGVPMDNDDIQAFDSHSTAIQATLAGEADIVTGSLLAWSLVLNQGEDFKVFCPYVKSDDYVIAGRNGVTTLDDLLDPKTRVGIDSPGGAGNTAVDAILQVNDIDATAEDFPNRTVIESSGLRESAFAADEVDATILHVASFVRLKEEVPDATIIASLPEDAPEFISLVYAARTEWLEQNRDTAVGFCAAVIKAGRELKDSYDLYLEAVNEAVEEADSYSDASLRGTWDMFVNYDMLPDDGDMEEDSVAFTLDVGVNSGVLDEAPAVGDLVDRSYLEEALELLDE